MCLIILANDVKSLDYKDLETAYDRNKNGFGVMYLDKKKILFQVNLYQKILLS